MKDNTDIIFVYKGRYTVRDAITVEYLSAIGKALRFSTGLVYDQDLFGVTDNVLSIPLLNKIISSDERVVAKILGRTPRMVVFLDGFNRRLWNDKISAAVKKENSSTLTVFLSCLRRKPKAGSYDFIIDGEPEYAFNKFLSDGIYRSGKGSYSFTELVNLDNLPLPDKTLFAPYVNFRDSYLIYTSKGCPGSCSYCEETIYKDSFGSGYFRRKNPGLVIAELEEAKRDFGIKEVIYKDSVFAIDKNWLKRYLKIYKERIGLPYKCFGKAGSFDDELAQLLKDSGCYCVEFGIQTFNEKLKSEVLKRQERTEDLLRAFSVCDRLRLRYDVDHLFGIPNETEEDHLESGRIYSGLSYLNRIKCHNLTFYKEAQIYEHAPSSVRNDPDYNADFFSSDSGAGAMVPANKAFSKLFKILPALPSKLKRWILMGKRWKIFGYLPSLCVIFFMLLAAAKNRDKRFLVYIKYYPLRLRRALLE